MMKTLLGIFKNALIALDQFFNCFIRMDGQWGLPDETLSARAWRQRLAYPRFHRIVDLFFFFDKQDGKGHCELSWEAEQGRAQLPSDYQTHSAN